MSKCNLTRFLRVNRRRVLLYIFICASSGRLVTKPEVIEIFWESMLAKLFCIHSGFVVYCVCTGVSCGCGWLGCVCGGCLEVGVVDTHHAEREIGIILKLLLTMVALRLQLQHHSHSPIRLSIIHVRDFIGFRTYFRLY